MEQRDEAVCEPEHTGCASEMNLSVSQERRRDLLFYFVAHWCLFHLFDLHFCCLIPSVAEDQQASLQLLRLRRAKRPAVDRQDPELHL